MAFQLSKLRQAEQEFEDARAPYGILGKMTGYSRFKAYIVASKTLNLYMYFGIPSTTVLQNN